ncbi:MAG: hypothetical protein AB1805_11630 [Nitrospirota bacterium]
MVGALGAFWGVAGVALLLGSAMYRLGAVALTAFAHELSPSHWASLLLVILFMAYAEGYRGFQQRFAPRVAARARYLRQHPRALHLLLAPLFCMGFFHATRRRRLTSLSVTFTIVALILCVRLLPQPWRGIIDAGVVIGLAWGLFSLLFFAIRAFTAERFDYAPDVPEDQH